MQVRDYQAAYAQLCSDVLVGYSESDHESFLRSQPAYTSFKLGRPTMTTGMDGTYEDLPVRLAGGPRADVTIILEVGMQTDGAKICDGPDWRYP